MSFTTGWTRTQHCLFWRRGRVGNPRRTGFKPVWQPSQPRLCSRFVYLSSIFHPSSLIGTFCFYCHVERISTVESELTACMSHQAFWNERIFNGTISRLGFYQCTIILNFWLAVMTNTQTLINREKYSFCIIKSFEYLKNVKNSPVLYLGLKLTIHVIKSQLRKILIWKFKFALSLNEKFQNICKIIGAKLMSTCCAQNQVPWSLWKRLFLGAG